MSIWVFTGFNKGKRNDLDEPIALLRDGATLSAIAREHPKTIVRFPKGMQLLAALLSRPRTRGRVRAVFLRGPTGIGKTTGARRFLEQRAGEEGFFIWSAKHDKGWWDGYEGQDWILIDDLDTGAIALGELLRLLQDLPYKLPVHGGQVHCQAHNFILTSNKPLKKLWPFADAEQLAALERRINAFNENNMLEDDDIEAIQGRPHGVERETWIAEWLSERFTDDNNEL